MKILIASDTHSSDCALIEAIQAHAPLDMVIHLGDLESTESLQRIDQAIPVPVARHFVLGNNDIFIKLDSFKEVPFGKHHKAFLSHGHRYGVSLGLDALRQEALRRGCDIAMFGHTHRPFYQNMDGVIMLNPGSISYPRGEERRRSYAILQVDDESGELEMEFQYI